MYDGIRAFGKENNRVKYLGVKTQFNTRGNDYFVSSIWYKREDLQKKPINTSWRDVSEEDKETEEKLDREAKLQARVVWWIRKPQHNYRNHPSFLRLLEKYGQLPGGYWGLENWKGFDEATALYNSYINNGKKLPESTDSISATEHGGKICDYLREPEPDENDDDEAVPSQGAAQEMQSESTKEKITRKGSRARKSPEKLGEYLRERPKKKQKLSLGIHVGMVSEKGKIPRCQYCRCQIEKRGEWHMVKVIEITTNNRLCKNELHYHFRCAKGGLEQSERDVNQLLAIVRSEKNIDTNEKQKIIMSIDGEE